MKNLKNILSVALAVLMLVVPNLGMIKEISAAGEGYVIPVTTEEGYTVTGLDTPIDGEVDNRQVTISVDNPEELNVYNFELEITNPSKPKRIIFSSIMYGKDNKKEIDSSTYNLVVFKGDKINLKINMEKFLFKDATFNDVESPETKFITDDSKYYGAVSGTINDVIYPVILNDRKLSITITNRIVMHNADVKLFAKPIEVEGYGIKFSDLYKSIYQKKGTYKAKEVAVDEIKLKINSINPDFQKSWWEPVSNVVKFKQMQVDAMLDINLDKLVDQSYTQDFDIPNNLEYNYFLANYPEGPVKFKSNVPTTITYSISKDSKGDVIKSGKLNPTEETKFDFSNGNQFKIVVTGAEALEPKDGEGDTKPSNPSEDEEITKKITILEKKIVKYEEEIKEKDKAISDKTEENDNLKAEIDKIKAEIENLKKERDDLKKKLEEGGTADEATKKELEDTKNKLSEAEADLEKAKAELEALKKADAESLEKAKENAKDQISKNDNLDETQKAEATEKVDNAETVEEVNKIVGDLALAGLEKKLAEKDKALAEAEADLEKANTKIEELKNEVEALKEKLATSSADDEETQKLIEEKNKQIKDLEDKLAKDEEELDAIKKENQDLKDRIAELEKSINNSDDEKLKTIAEKEKEIADLNNKIADLEKAKAELEALKKADAESLEKAKENAKDQISKNENLDEAQKVEATTKVDNAKTVEEINKIIGDLALADLEKKLAEKDKALEEKEEALEKSNKELKEAKEKLEGSLKEKVEELEKIKKELAELKKNKSDEEAKEKEDKKNANDPAYQKKKLQDLVESAKRIRYPSEDLEKAIDQAYDVLYNRYSELEDYKWAIENLERILQNMKDNRRNRYKLEVEDINATDKEITGKTETKWYIDIYNGKKRILNGQADYKGNFSIEVKKDKFKVNDKLKVVATDPMDNNKYKEVEIVVGGETTSVTNQEGTVITPDMLKAEGHDPNEMAVFPINKNYYNIIKNGEKTTVYMDVNSYAVNGRTMLPIRFAANALGYNVEYDEVNKEAIFTNTSNPVLAKATFRMNVYTGHIYGSNGTTYQMDQRPVISNQRTFVSISNLAKAFGGTHGNINDGVKNTIEWDQANYSAILFKFAK